MQPVFQAPQTLQHWLDCPGTLQARREPLSTLSTVPGKSVALARRTLRRLGAHAINSSSSSSSSRRVVNYIASQQHAPMRRSTGYRPGGRPLNLHRTCMLARRGAAGDVQSHTNDTTRLRPTHRDAGMTGVRRSDRCATTTPDFRHPPGRRRFAAN